MILENYIRRTGITKSELARRSGLTKRVFLHLLKTGRDVPLDIAIKIEKGTGGAIDSLDLALENHPADRIYMASRRRPKVMSRKQENEYEDDE
jgi:plasmid maintenance system antidote protein VapI